MQNERDSSGSEDSTLLNGQNEFEGGTTARAVVRRDGESVALVRNPDDSGITLFGYDATDEEGTFGLVVTIEKVIYDHPEDRPNHLVVSPVERFAPTNGELAAARGEQPIAGNTSESDETDDSTAPRSAEQSSGADTSGRDAPLLGTTNGIVVDGSGERDAAGRSPFADKNRMEDLARRKP